MKRIQRQGRHTNFRTQVNRKLKMKCRDGSKTKEHVKI